MASLLQRQQNAESAKKLVNVNAKSFFDALPKPSDLFNLRSQQTKKDNKQKSSIPFKSENPATKQISQTQRGSINAFIQKKGNIADVFKSFGF
jgi:hypothetical protein